MEKEQTKKKKSFLWLFVSLTIIIIGFLCYVPFWVNSAYLQGGGMQTVWDGSEFLIFYGSVLTAIGTVFLGALTIWQNHQLNTTNEKAQKRIMEISYSANEITVINKMVERENIRIDRIKKTCEIFVNLCMFYDVVYASQDGKDMNRIIGEKKFELLTIYHNFTMEIVGDFYNIINVTALLKKAKVLFDTSVNFYDQLSLDKKNLTKTDIDNQILDISEFITLKNKYILDAETRINDMLTGKTSMEEIRTFYQSVREAYNEQAEDGE